MEKEPHKAVDFIIANAPKYAQAKANRVHIENYLRVVKSELMLTQEEGTQGIKEAYAYSNPSYKQQLDALKIATEEEERIKYLIEAAKLRVEIFKVEEYTKRTEMKNL